MTELSTRLPNSTMPWKDAGATIEVAVQRGHVSQPSPESVSRTAAPLTTRRPIATAAKMASRRKVAGETETERARIAPPSLKTPNDHDAKPTFRRLRDRFSGLCVMIVAERSGDAAAAVAQCCPQRQPVDGPQHDQGRTRVDVAHRHVGVGTVDTAHQLRVDAVEVTDPGEKVRAVERADLRRGDDDVRLVVDDAGERGVGVGIEQHVGRGHQALDLGGQLASVGKAGLGYDDAHDAILSCRQSQRKVRAAIAMAPPPQARRMTQSCRGTAPPSRSTMRSPSVSALIGSSSRRCRAVGPKSCSGTTTPPTPSSTR